MKPATNEWLSQAKKDIVTAKTLQSHVDTEPDVASAITFHSQQAVEKILKAHLEEAGQTVPKLHDLIALYGRLSASIQSQLAIDMTDLGLLNDVYIDTRYPSGNGLLPTGDPTAEDAKSILSKAEKIYEDLKSELK